MASSDKLREISRTLQIQKKLERKDILATLNVLIDLAERVERLETVRPDRKE
jgi:cell division protein ZapA (FtsZ GTPase activity inhibitor)